MELPQKTSFSRTLYNNIAELPKEAQLNILLKLDVDEVNHIIHDVPILGKIIKMNYYWELRVKQDFPRDQHNFKPITLRSDINKTWNDYYDYCRHRKVGKAKCYVIPEVLIPKTTNILTYMNSNKNIKTFVQDNKIVRGDIVIVNLATASGFPEDYLDFIYNGIKFEQIDTEKFDECAIIP